MVLVHWSNWEKKKLKIRLRIIVMGKPITEPLFCQRNRKTRKIFI